MWSNSADQILLRNFCEFRRNPSRVARIIVTQANKFTGLLREYLENTDQSNAKWKVHFSPTFSQLRVRFSRVSYRNGTTSISEARCRLANDSENGIKQRASAMQMIKLRPRSVNKFRGTASIYRDPFVELPSRPFSSRSRNFRWKCMHAAENVSLINLSRGHEPIHAFLFFSV